MQVGVTALACSVSPGPSVQHLPARRSPFPPHKRLFKKKKKNLAFPNLMWNNFCLESWHWDWLGLLLPGPLSLLALPPTLYSLLYLISQLSLLHPVNPAFPRHPLSCGCPLTHPSTTTVAYPSPSSPSLFSKVSDLEWKLVRKNLSIPPASMVQDQAWVMCRRSFWRQTGECLFGETSPQMPSWPLML